ncbi:hypothetical protein Scani_61670 [Streptomyces caniferus]|uniref:Uncharacterized protein n=1 Tax=Streptomyces caniferus TaxID=285557 RepID=A0A640SF45_9ACTN|nr:hypothetical protein Scani_61670 [Streptomyces caniferus]
MGSIGPSPLVFLSGRLVRPVRPAGPVPARPVAVRGVPRGAPDVPVRLTCRCGYCPVAVAGAWIQ